MSVQSEEAVTTVPAAAEAPVRAEIPDETLDDWELDVSIVESGPEADRLIRMTDDGCGQTCESACQSTCP